MRSLLDELEKEWQEAVSLGEVAPETVVDSRDEHRKMPQRRRERRVAPPFHWRDHPGPCGELEPVLTPEDLARLAWEIENEAFDVLRDDGSE